MHNFQEEVINKKINRFKERNINIDADDILNFLENVYFKHNQKNDDSLRVFLEANNLDDIINFLMSDALINPKF